MARRPRWKPTLQGTGSLADVLDTFETGLEETLDGYWNVHIDDWLCYAACCHALQGRPQRAIALVERVQQDTGRLTGWGELAGFLAKAGFTDEARQCAERAEVLLAGMELWEGSTTYRYAPLAAAWSLLERPERAAELFALAEEGLSHSHNHGSKVRILLRAYMLIDDLDSPARILGDARWDEHASGPYLGVLFERDFAAGVEKLRGPALKQGSGESMHRTVDALCDAGRHEEAWEVLEAFTRYYRLPTRLKLVRRMIAEGKREAGLALAEAQLAAITEWPLDAPAWVEILTEHAPERAAAHQALIDESIEQARRTSSPERCLHPLARILIRRGALAEALSFVPGLRRASWKAELLRVICATCHREGVPMDEPMAAFAALIEEQADAKPRERIEIALSMTGLFWDIDDAESAESAIAEAYTHAAAAASSDKRFRYSSIRDFCITQGDLMAAYAALKRMPSGSQKYEVLPLARAWINAGHITDAIQLVLRVPSRKESPFRIFERTFRMLQVANEATHPGMKALMPG